jgi:uncharacterized flavoprotein (TIGR03862 family)
MEKEILIVGSGPAALLAADLLSAAGKQVRVFERRAAPGWKLLVAGSSGLNVSHEGEDLSLHYPARASEMRACLEAFGREEWLAHLHGLGEETFLGTSRRHFLVNKKASSLLAKWMSRLEARGVVFHFGEELVDFSSPPRATFASGNSWEGSALLLALGGPSWEKEPSNWPAAFLRKGLRFTRFTPANAGYELLLPPEFFQKAEGKPVKGLTLTTRLGSKQGECMITHYGLEGTPVYSVGCQGLAEADLKPDLSLEKLTARLAQALLHRRLQAAKLSPGAELLSQALITAPEWRDPARLAAALKKLPLPLGNPRPLSESISARGGVSWDELEGLELKKLPGVYCVGEMVDWDAPTGGFLLQGCVSMAAAAVQFILRKTGG